jgi:hypothetical protein
MKRSTRTLYLMALLSAIALVSCRKEADYTTTSDSEKSEAARRKAATKKAEQVSYILEEIYKDPEVRAEVNAAIKSEFYEDETILLKDLLDPEISPVYKTAKLQDEFKKGKAQKGKFAQKFKEVLRKGAYRNAARFAAPGARTSDVFDDGGVSIYFPYSENFSNVSEDRVTIVFNDEEGDGNNVPGQRPYVCGYNRTEPEICYTTVNVNDNYADVNPTHIIGTATEPPMQSRTEGGPEIRKVLLGWIRCTRQYDDLRETRANGKNGKGSEIMVIRASGYLKVVNQQVTDLQDVIPVHFKRGDIRKGRWKRMYAIWDSDWKVDNLQQVFGIYEEDTEGTKRFTGSIGTTLRVADSTASATVTANIGYDVTVKTQDEIIRQLGWSRASYFGDASNNQGHGFYDGWPIYDGGAHVSYTLPWRFVP